MERVTDVLGRPGMAVKEHLLPGDEDVVEHHEKVDLVETAGERTGLARVYLRETRTVSDRAMRRTHGAPILRMQPNA
jgi:hypothetical protein